jgi:hypothetical protein
LMQELYHNPPDRAIFLIGRLHMNHRVVAHRSKVHNAMPCLDKRVDTKRERGSGTA